MKTSTIGQFLKNVKTGKFVAEESGKVSVTIDNFPQIVSLKGKKFKIASIDFGAGTLTLEAISE